MDFAFHQRLSQGPILADGAMGTELNRRRNLGIDVCFEHLNLTAPELVRAVHLDYIEAGAEIIETNTFGANSVRLERHGLASAVQEINRQAVELAREAQRLTGQRVWIAGAVGPLGKPVAPLWPGFQAEAQAAFREQIQALVEAGVDLLILETFPSLAEIQEAIAAAR
ncbi:MAG: homocysteine S-methyltransferase family protein, partial [Dehalococcoidia bacterium]|nr:homocysteine S-methyltransferase family protein [Dehalococcoidia bacterium]